MFLEYVARGPCEVREKIRNDTFRYASSLADRSTINVSIERWPQIEDLRSVYEKICWFDCSTPSYGEIMVRSLPFMSASVQLTWLPDRQETDHLGFTYVQGMNVLAAPFLYTMPSELEAFFCFAKFIEESCPLYVQPTLEGVHRGLKVSPLCELSITVFL